MIPMQIKNNNEILSDTEKYSTHERNTRGQAKKSKRSQQQMKNDANNTKTITAKKAKSKQKIEHTKTKTESIDRK